MFGFRRHGWGLPMSSEFAIKVSDIGKCYRIYERPHDRLLQMLIPNKRKFHHEFWALRDVSFSIGSGETVGIVGLNGSGKSTLLQMICGTVSPSCGEVAVSGRVAALLELGAGFNSEFTGRENVLLNAAILGFRRESIQERMAEILDFSELGEFLDQPVKTYSSGMYARLAFSIAIHVDPEILIIDEALAVGDSRFVAKCMRRIKDIQTRGVTILFVSHDVGSVRTLCDRVIWLNKGKLVEDGDVFSVTGRFMEFVFQDEQTEEQVLRSDIIECGDVKRNKAGIMLPVTSKTAASNDNNDKLEKHSSSLLDARPVIHWGSRKGIIKSASVCNECGCRTDVVAWGGIIQVIIKVSVPCDISREHLSVAFSIKDLKGIDIVVSTTHDLNIVQLPDAERFAVCFQMTNILATGKYLLVAAVENRQNRDIHYYEYFEGAHYFASLSDQRFFGIVQPAIRQLVKVD